jgi:hypothetical protein
VTSDILLLPPKDRVNPFYFLKTRLSQANSLSYLGENYISAMNDELKPIFYRVTRFNYILKKVMQNIKQLTLKYISTEKFSIRVIFNDDLSELRHLSH